MAARRFLHLAPALLVLALPLAATAKDGPKADRETKRSERSAPAPALDAAAINGADLAQGFPEHLDRPSPAILKAQVLLDRAAISPGAIDGRDGENFRSALAVFAGRREPSADKAEQPVAATGSVPEASFAGVPPQVWGRLAATSPDPVVQDYTLTEEDARGPYVAKIPAKMEQQADLDGLGYTSPVEMLAERFHMSQDLLKALNPGKNLGRAGESILVAAVAPLMLPKDAKRGKPQDPVVRRIVVDKAAHRVEAFDGEDKPVGVYPASIGSTEKPAPSGSFTVKGVALDPTYTYNPKYAFKGVTAKHRFDIAPGPNNPVGVAWIDLSADSYGIHGTPEPEKVGKTASHGCIRLTNWDVRTLAAHVAGGAKVVFKE